MSGDIDATSAPALGTSLREALRPLTITGLSTALTVIDAPPAGGPDGGSRG